ncbi:Polysaccharide deacetylase [Tindallia californiensis]|uniref:Polysaccharide deacetylase n=1 Tax=Tindallia californiensis TaxID=159292 RepID=A0A1H3JMD2_9FIRM|nr:Polysaccharide deacetylase [Tindallia californiensis]
MYQRIVNEGHQLGNHTYSHDYEKIYQSPEAFMEDVEKLQDFLETSTGFRPEVFRFPAGSNNQIYRRVQQDNPYLMIEIKQLLREKELPYFDWNASSTDAAAVTLDTDIIIQNTLKHVSGHQNAIILFHDSGAKSTTVEALPTIIRRLDNLGYRFDVLTPDSFYVHFNYLLF